MKIKNKEQIEQIRKCGIISSKLFKHLSEIIHPGLTTHEINNIADTFIRDHGATPSFKGYMDFPSSICASVNEEVIHGLPHKRVLQEGDVVGIDVGVEINGMISDSAKTFPVGVISEEVQKLLEVTEEALYRGIAQVKSRAIINDIGGAIEDFVRPKGYGIVKGYCGHGVGFANHEEPEIPNYRYRQGKRKLISGLVIAIEPMINLGDEGTFTLDDGWTVVTIDGKYSAHFEHTVAVTEKGFDILTIDPADMPIIKQKYSFL